MNARTVLACHVLRCPFSRILAPLICSAVMAASAAFAGLNSPPAFGMSLSPAEMGAGSCTALSFTIDNSANKSPSTELTFTLQLPNGVTLAAPANPISDCGGTLSAVDGGTSISLSGGQVAAGTICRVEVTLTMSGPGPFVLTTGDLSSSLGNSGPATDTLGAPAQGPVLGFTKRFFPNLVPLGGTTTLTYTIENQGLEDAANLTFTDMLPAGIVIANPSNLTSSCPSVQLTAVPGTQEIIFNPDTPNPTLLAGQSCTLTLDVVGVTAGQNLSISGNLTSNSAGGETVSGGFACAVLEVLAPNEVANLSFSKEFTDDPVAPGGTGTLEFTITNNSQSETYSDISFTDDLNATLPGLAASEIPVLGGTIVNAAFNGGGSAPIISGAWDYLDRIENENGLSQDYPVDGSGNAWNSEAFEVTTSTIGPWGSANAPLQGDVIDGFPLGTPNILGGIDNAPNLQNLTTTYLFRNEFEVTAAQAAETDWLLEYLIDDGAIIYVNGVEVFRTPSMPTGPVITTTLSGLGDEVAYASGSPSLSGILVEGTNTIAVEVHQNTLESSDVGMDLQLVPASQSAVGGFTYVDDIFDSNDPGTSNGSVDPAGGNTGGAITVTAGGKGFLANFFNPESSGGFTRTFTLTEAATTTVNLRYRLLFDSEYDNNEYGEAILTIDGIRYGAGPESSLSRFTGDGNGGIDSDTGWQFATFNVALGLGDHTIVLGAYNSSSGNAAEITQVWFDDIEVIVPEITVPVCGPNSELTGTNLLTLSGGSLGPGESCTFSVEVRVPIATPIGTYLNTTSRLTTELLQDQSMLIGFPATDTLLIQPIPPNFTQSFSPDSIASGSLSTLTFTINNNASSLDATAIDFTDVLPAGTVIATPSGAATTCTGGTLTAQSGTGTISYTGGTVAAGNSCTVTVNVTANDPGAYLNSTGELISSLGNSGSASATLTVNPPPLFSKAFAPLSINAGQIGTLTFTIDNSASTTPANEISFTDSLPAGLVLSNPVNFSSTCIGGSVSAGPGSSTFSYSNGTVPAGAVCTLSIEVTSTVGGTYLNTTGDLVSSLGNSGLASATLQVEAIVSVLLSASESADPVIAGSGPGNLTYTITARNNGPSTATGITVSEALTLPAEVSLVSITASAGTTFTDPTWEIGSLAPGGLATLTVVLTVGSSAAEGAGVISDTSTLETVNEMNIAGGDPSVTEATSITTRADLQITNTESIDPVIAGSGPENLGYLVTVTNNGPSTATNVTVADTMTLPPGVTIASVIPSNGTNFTAPDWTVGTLTPGTTAILRVILTVDSSASMGSDVIVNDVSVTTVDQPQINPGDESAADTTSITREVDLVLTVIESRDPVLAGFALPGNLRHSILITNNGPSDASGVLLTTISTLPDGVSLVGVPIQALDDLSAGNSTTVPVDFNVSASALGGTDVLATTGSVVANETILLPGDDADTEATSIVSPASLDLSAGEIILDTQTALFKQTITVTNNNPFSVPAFRLLVNGLPTDVTIQNSQGSSGGNSFLLYNQALAAGASVDLVVEYFQLDASGGFDPSFEIELLDATEVSPSGEGAEINRIVALPNQDILVEFDSTAGQSYTTQYSADGKNWFNVVPAIVAGTNRTQWIDNGPPKTPSHPSTAKSRLYRVIEQTND